MTLFLFFTTLNVFCYPSTYCYNASCYTISKDEYNLYDRANNLFFSHEYLKAIKQADILINKYPHSYMGYNIRGIAKAYNNNFNEGMQDIDKSLSIKSDYGYAIFNKALTYEL